jgi:folylpolyglutamate synthase/dihydropteroate synthase
MPGPVRILICGSLYLAGRVLAAHCDRMVSDISGPG